MAASCRVECEAAIPVARWVERFLFLRPVRTNPPQGRSAAMTKVFITLRRDGPQLAISFLIHRRFWSATF